MKKFKCDKYGVPILSRTDIELRVEGFIKYFDEKCLLEPCLTPLASISKQLKEKYGVSFVFGQDLGMSEEGYKYRGRFHIPTKTIYIDSSLEYGEPRFNFTLAHEIGHFVLHRNISPSILKDDIDEIRDTSRDLILDQIEGDNPRTWLEWQANKFASSLLLPRRTIPVAVINKQKEMGVNRQVGTIYLDRQQKNNSDYYEIMETLVTIYQVSKSAIRIRLRELNILVETKMEESFNGGGPKHINDALLKILGSFN